MPSTFRILFPSPAKFLRDVPVTVEFFEHVLSCSISFVKMIVCVLYFSEIIFQIILKIIE